MTRLAILWHMHQPFYQDLLTGELALPWVRLHALKDYWGMVALLREFPGLRVTFNLVPSLLVQLEAYARGEARDRHLEIGLNPAESLSDEDRAFCVEQFFHAHRLRMIDPYPRYRELFQQRGGGGARPSARSQASQFSVDDIRDLQVWHKLVWVDESYHKKDERVRALLAKGRGFSEQDKAILRDVEMEILRRVIPEYAEAAERGQAELSTSPFYHPILPLLCDTDIYLRTHPHSRMPREPFRHQEDAVEQLSRSVAYHERLFGRRPAGVWPSEGSVSDAMVPLLARAGFRWMATDEMILARTNEGAFTRDAEGHLHQPEVLYRPYSVGEAGYAIACGFRDHTLSDLVGFRYASWSAEGAADDFLDRLLTAGRRYASGNGGGEATVFVILDGENAWEYYDGQGRPFLRALYARLTSHPGIRTVTMSEACAAPEETLPSIFPGSWVNGDFYVWIGHADDHRAWGQLADARRVLGEAANSAPAEALARAREEMLIAEGSDWFWWYGDDHSSDHDLAFDELFRRHVRNVYRALGKPVPEELFVTNITTAPSAVEVDGPTGFIQPVIDGDRTNYFEWIGAGRVDTSETPGAMHQAGAPRGFISSVEWGFDLEHLFIRVDGTKPMRRWLETGVEVRVTFLKPPGVQVVLRLEPRDADVRVEIEARLTAGDWHTLDCAGLRAAAGEILECRIPFRCLPAVPGATLALLVMATARGMEVEHHPRHGPIEVEVPDTGYSRKDWTA